MLAGLPEDAPLLRFEKHARSTNEIFGLAAKAVAHVLCRLEKAQSLGHAAGFPPPPGTSQAQPGATGGNEAAATEAYERAMAPFCGPPWWEAVATPDDVSSLELPLCLPHR